MLFGPPLMVHGLLIGIGAGNLLGILRAILSQLLISSMVLLLMHQRKMNGFGVLKILVSFMLDPYVSLFKKRCLIILLIPLILCGTHGFHTKLTYVLGGWT